MQQQRIKLILNRAHIKCNPRRRVKHDINTIYYIKLKRIVNFNNPYMIYSNLLARVFHSSTPLYIPLLMTLSVKDKFISHLYIWSSTIYSKRKPFFENIIFTYIEPAVWNANANTKILLNKLHLYPYLVVPLWQWLFSL